MNSRRDVLEMHAIFGGSIGSSDLVKESGRDYAYSLMTVQAGLSSSFALGHPDLQNILFHRPSPAK